MRKEKLGTRNSGQSLQAMKNAELIHADTSCANFQRYIRSLASKRKIKALYCGLMSWIKCAKVSVASISTTLKRRNGVKLTLKVPMYSLCISTRIKRENYSTLRFAVKTRATSGYIWTVTCSWLRVRSSSRTSLWFYRLTRAQGVSKEANCSMISTVQLKIEKNT